MQIGGLLGDVIFFAVSGFCLFNIKDGFFKWYKKRIIRIYPKVWIMTTIYLIMNLYTLEKMNIFSYYIYPTYYHFIGSIIILYVLYYLIIRVKILNENILKILINVSIIQLICYVFIYDKSYYHIDVVREPMIRFLFFQAMLLGAWFRLNKDKYINKNNVYNWIFLIISLIIYFGSKLLFSKLDSLSNLQLINQYALIICLYYVLRCFAGIDSKLEKMPKKITKVIGYISSITLEIYLVQYPLIPILAHKAVFPVNWLIITFTILFLATILHYLVETATKIINKKGKMKNENFINRSV